MERSISGRGYRGLGLTLFLIVILLGGAFVFWGGDSGESIEAPDDRSASTEHATPPEPVLNAQPLAESGPDVPAKTTPVARSIRASLSDGSVSGRVFSVDGQPVADATVVLRPLRPLRAVLPPDVTTDADGAFVIENLPITSYSVWAESEAGSGGVQATLVDHAPHAYVSIVLRPGAPVRGKVISGGAVVVGARIVALRHDGQEPPRRGRPALVRRSDDAGAFAFESLPPQVWEFYVTAEKYAPVTTEPVAVGTTNLVVRMNAGATVSGRVVDAEKNSPLSGVVVTAQRRNFDIEPETNASGDDGGFSFRGLAVDDYVFDIDDPVRALVSGPVTVSVTGATGQTVELRVVDGGVVRGRLIDSATRAGIAGGSVLANAEGGRGVRRTSSPTDNNGAFEIVGLGSGAYRLFPAMLLRGYPSVGRGDQGVAVQVAAGQVLEGVEVEVRQGTTISGVVVRQDGTPVSGAMVRGEGTGWQDQTPTGADGTFVLAGLNGANRVRISAEAAGFETSTQGPYDVPEHGLEGLRLILDLARNGLIAGKVVDEKGRPLEAKVLGMIDGRSFPATPATYSTGPDGAFILMDLVPGTWRLLVSYKSEVQQELQQIRLSGGQQVRNLTLVLPVGDRLSITGRVTDGEGKPLRATVAIRQAGVGGEGPILVPNGFSGTNEEGYYEADGLEPGVYQLTAGANGYSSQTIENVEAGSDGVDFALEADVLVTGQVVGTRGQPVTSFTIAAARSANVSPERLSPQHVSDVQGRFTLHVAPGNYYLYVSAPGIAPQYIPIGRVPETPSEDLLIRLQGG